MSIYLTVHDGQITRIDEYLNTKQVNKVAFRMAAHVGVVRAVRTMLELSAMRRQLATGPARA